MRTIVPRENLALAMTFHSWAVDEDLPNDHQVRCQLTNGLDERDRTAQELEETLSFALIIAATHDTAREGVAALRLIGARETHERARLRLQMQWGRAVGGDIRPRPRLIKAPGPEPAEMSERRRAYVERLRTSSPQCHPPKPVTSEELTVRDRPALRRFRRNAS
jgi:hypothetical protein